MNFFMIFFLCKIRLFGAIIKTPSSGQNCHEVNQSWTLPIDIGRIGLKSLGTHLQTLRRAERARFLLTFGKTHSNSRAKLQQLGLLMIFRLNNMSMLKKQSTAQFLNFFIIWFYFSNQSLKLRRLNKRYLGLFFSPLFGHFYCLIIFCLPGHLNRMLILKLCGFITFIKWFYYSCISILKSKT